MVLKKIHRRESRHDHRFSHPYLSGADFVTPVRIRSVYDQIHPDKLVLAYMGGWDCFDEAEGVLAGCNVYLDTAYTISPMRSETGDIVDTEQYTPMSREQFMRFVKIFGADHILFGSDSPWTDMKESVELVRESGLNLTELKAVLGGNAARLLNLT